MSTANQRVFDVALTHIRTQKRKSVDKEGNCVYRASNGDRCAFSPCIEHYDESLEGQNPSYLIEDIPHVLFEWAKEADPDLCEEIQDAHDLVSDPFMEYFEKEMAKIAKEWGLIYRKPNTGRVIKTAKIPIITNTQIPLVTV